MEEEDVTFSLEQEYSAPEDLKKVNASAMKPKSLHDLLALRAGGAPTPSQEESASSGDPNIEFNPEASLPNALSTLIYNESEGGPSQNEVVADEFEQEMPSNSKAIFDDDDADLLEILGTRDRVEEKVQENKEINSRLVNNRITSLEIQNTQLSKSLEEAQIEIKRANEQYQSSIDEMNHRMEEERQRMRVEFDELNSARFSDQQSQQSMRNKLEHMGALEGDLQALVEEKQALEDRISRGREDSINTKNELAAAKAEMNRMRMEMGRMVSEFEACKADNQEMRNELMVRQRDDTGGGAGGARAAQQQQIQTMLGEKQWLEQQMQDMKRDLAERIQMNNQLTSDMAAMERNVASLNADNSSIRQQFDQADNTTKRDLREAQQRIHGLETELRDTKSQNQYLNSQQQQLQHQFQQQEQNIQQQKQQIHQQMRQIEQQQQEINMLEKRNISFASRTTAASTAETSSSSSSFSNSRYEPPPPRNSHPRNNAFSTDRSNNLSNIVQDNQNSRNPVSLSALAAAPEFSSLGGGGGGNSNMNPMSSHNSNNNDAGASGPRVSGAGRSLASMIGRRGAVTGTEGGGGGRIYDSSSQPFNSNHGDGMTRSSSSSSGSSNNHNSCSSGDLNRAPPPPHHLHQQNQQPVPQRMHDLMQSKGQYQQQHGGELSGGRIMPHSQQNVPFGTVAASPFANDVTSAQINSVFDQLDRQLTSLMTEKRNLQDESEKLHTRGLKTLKDRTRLQAVEFRLGELARDISQVRKDLSAKPN